MHFIINNREISGAASRQLRYASPHSHSRQLEILPIRIIANTVRSTVRSFSPRFTRLCKTGCSLRRVGAGLMRESLCARARALLHTACTAASHRSLRPSAIPARTPVTVPPPFPATRRASTDPGRCLRVPLGHSATRMRGLAIMTSCTMTPQRPIGGARRRRRRRRRVVVAVF